MRKNSESRQVINGLLGQGAREVGDFRVATHDLAPVHLEGSRQSTSKHPHGAQHQGADGNAGDEQAKAGHAGCELSAREPER
jgi:hypothetical protein